MTNARRLFISIMVALVFLVAAVVGIIGWQDQVHRATLSKVVSTHSTAIAPGDLPIVIGPILR